MKFFVFVNPNRSINWNQLGIRSRVDYREDMIEFTWATK